MTEKRIVVISDRLTRHIDKYRGQLTRADFVAQCMDKLFGQLDTGGVRRAAPQTRRAEPEMAPEPSNYVTRQEFAQFQSNIDRLQQGFLDFFIRYGKQLAGGDLSEEDSGRFNEELRRLLQL